MNFTNINDPAGVAALLDQLKSSSAWKELELSSATSAPEVAETPIASSSSALHHVPSPNTVDEPLRPPEPYGEHKVSSNAILGSSVASLLSQLKPFSAGSVDPLPNSFAYDYGKIQNSSAGALPSIPLVGPAPPAARLEPADDRRNFTFRQSLPVISELSDSPTFVTAVKKMKADQDNLERQLWADREAIYAKYHDKLKVAQTKARMIGGTISQHEINMITDAFKKEIQKFDHERVLPAWDGLVSRQQLELAQIEVPTMFVTADGEHRERQQQVIGLLETLLGPKAA